MFDGNNPNVNVTVTLMPIEKAKNYNPFYETPFDGEVGKRGDVLHRANYGVGFSEPILLQDEPRLTTNTFTGTPLLNIKSKTSNNILDLEKGIVLKYDLENKELRFNPSIPTPLSMKVKNTLFGQLNAGYNLENVSDKLVNRWVIVGSTIGNNTDKCLDFEGNDNRVFVEQVDGTKRTLSWSNAKEGTVTLATNIFLPKDGNGSVKATSLDKEKVTLTGPYTLGETIWLSGYNNAALTGNYDNLEYLFNQLREEKMCITKGNELVTNIWWNPEYLAEIINNTSKANTDCKLDVYNPFLKIQ